MMAQNGSYLKYNYYQKAACNSAGGFLRLQPLESVWQQAHDGVDLHTLTK